MTSHLPLPRPEKPAPSLPRRFRITPFESARERVATAGFVADELKVDQRSVHHGAIEGRVLIPRVSSGQPTFTAKGSIIPVLAVDDEPVTAGFGRLGLPAEPGWHLVTAQVQSIERPCTISYPVWVEPGETTTFDYVGRTGNDDLRTSWTSYREYEPRIGSLGELGVPRPEIYLRRRGFIFRSFVAMMVILVVAGTVNLWLQSNMAVSNPDLYPALSNGLTAVALTAFVGAVGYFLWQGWKNRHRRESAFYHSEKMSHHDPAAWEHHHSGVSRLYCLGQGVKCEVSPDAGKAAIVLDAELWRGLGERPSFVATGSGEVPPQAVMYRRAPQVYLDGEPLPRGWTRWWVEVEPGRHTLRVDLEDEHGRSSLSQGEDVSQEFEVDVKPGSTAKVLSTVDVRYSFTQEYPTTFEGSQETLTVGEGSSLQRVYLPDPKVEMHRA